MKMRFIAALALAWTLSSATAQTKPNSSAPAADPLQPTIRENRITTTRGDGAKAEAQPNAVSVRSIESMVSSTQDLNAIRDGYLRVLSGDGCRPDVAARVAELRALLGERKPDAPPASGGQSVPTLSAANLENSMLALALDWYDRPVAEDSSMASANPAARDTERAKLLEKALSPHERQTAETRNAGDAVALKSELERLLASCHLPQR